MFGWFKARRRRQLLREPFPAAWLPWLDELPFYGTLTDDERALLRQHARVLVAEKGWEGCKGLELTERMQVTIAAQACLLILALPHEAYRRVTSILVYPGSFRTEDTAYAEGVGALGLASSEGPIVLAWDSAYAGGRDPHDGRNVVFHEFAHALDGLDGAMDGVPPAGGAQQERTWRGVLAAEYERLLAAVDRGRVTLLDDYGAKSPAELFAVATECFFEKPVALRKKHEVLYALLAAFYRQDPARR